MGRRCRWSCSHAPARRWPRRRDRRRCPRSRRWCTCRCRRGSGWSCGELPRQFSSRHWKQPVAACQTRSSRHFTPTGAFGGGVRVVVQRARFRTRHVWLSKPGPRSTRTMRSDISLFPGRIVARQRGQVRACRRPAVPRGLLLATGDELCARRRPGRSPAVHSMELLVWRAGWLLRRRGTTTQVRQPPRRRRHSACRAAYAPRR